MNNGFVIAVLSVIAVVSAQNYAFVSVLSSNEFLLTAKVLAHRLKVLNASIPYVVVVTEDITKESRGSLQQQGVKIVDLPKIDTPYLSTHTATKYQYTKIRLWEMVEYDVIVHLDLDLLPVEDIGSLFHCGTFCASFRHSDMFNSGVFVLKTNKTIFEDMANQVTKMYSYDGGDQGFLNSYFSDLKFAPMFDEDNTTHQRFTADHMRLSAAFNFDIGVYYINGGRVLIKPKIIHYTLGPTKPWIWWTYPLFDLNNFWLEARYEMEAANEIPNNNVVLVAVQICVVFCLLFLKNVFELLLDEKLRKEAVGIREKLLATHSIVLLSIVFCVKIMPSGAYPVPAWVFFSSNLVTVVMTLTSCYGWLRLGIRLPCVIRLLVTSSVLLLSLAASWILVANIGPFGIRAVIAAALLVYNELFFVLVLRRTILTANANCVRYELLPSAANKIC